MPDNTLWWPDIFAEALALAAAEDTAPDPSLPVSLRLSPDAMHLLLYVRPDAEQPARDVLLTHLRDQCERLRVDLPLDAARLEGLLRDGREGIWVTVAAGQAPAPPADSYVELYVPLSRDTDNELGQPRRYAVRAGDVLARLHPEQPGSQGRDLLGGSIAVRAPRPATLPRGENTALSDDGMLLLAACDGEVVLHDRLIHVQPVQVLDGDAIRVGEPVYCGGSAFVRGSIGPCRRIEARGDVHVEGHVHEATICSSDGNISVHGSVTGDAGSQALLDAAGDVTCGTALHAMLRAGADVYLLTRARRCAIEAGGHVHVRHSIEESLYEVQMRIGGGVVLPRPVDVPTGPVAAERRHSRAAASLAAEIGLHGAEPLVFAPCLIEDLSVSGARCRVGDPSSSASAMPAPGTLVQLKWTLPECDGQLVVLARVARAIEPGHVGVAFLEMPRGDEDRLAAYCRALLDAQPDAALGSPRDRANRAL